MACICRDAFAFRRNILPLLYDLIGNDTRYLEGKGLLEIWGRKIHVIGAHDARAEGKLRGATFKGAYVDEVSLIPEIAWQILVQRCAMGGARIFGTTNPDSPAHWLKRSFIDDNPDVKAFHFTMIDNPKLTEEERNYLQRQHRGLWYRRFVLGEWCLAEGAVFDFFDERMHVLSRTPCNPKFTIIGVDYGTTNPCAFTMIHYNDDVSPFLFIEKEYYWDSKKKGRQKTDSEYAEDLAAFIEGYPIRAIFIDPSAASFKLEIRRQGINVNVRDAENDVLNGIRELSTLLANGDLKIKNTCPNLISEMQSYCWDTKASERGEDEVIKKFDHAIDSMRYGIFTCFGKKLSLGERPVDNFRTLGYNPMMKR